MVNVTSEKRLSIVSNRNFRQIPQLVALGKDRLDEIELISRVLPFRTNNFIIEELIDWNDPEDALINLTFPSRHMLHETDYDRLKSVLQNGNAKELEQLIQQIRGTLNRDPSGQLTLNIPKLKDGTIINGIQHKYPETVLFFPSQGQTCHAYCSFCFRWNQFVGDPSYRFAAQEADGLIAYLREHPEVTDVLFTGGDPMVMAPQIFDFYIDALLGARLPNLRTLRIGSKSLTYWPYKFLNGADAEKIKQSFHKVVDSGLNLSFMAHFNHLNELRNETVQRAVKVIQSCGAVIRTQSPVLRTVNDQADIWARMWQEQVRLGMIPYYMFVARDTGAWPYFAVPLAKCSEIYGQACRSISGLGRTVRGPSMSCTAGKVEVLGVQKIFGEKVFVLRMLQSRNPDDCYKPFFARFDEEALWIDELELLDTIVGADKAPHSGVSDRSSLPVLGDLSCDMPRSSPLS